jgi:hypothetical protein
MTRLAPLAALLLTATALVAPLAAPSSARADSQSSNSSSNCSNGRCSRVESYREERGGWQRGHVEVERWRERRAPIPWPRAWDERAWPAPPWAWEDRPRYRQDRRDRDDD